MPVGKHDVGKTVGSHREAVGVHWTNSRMQDMAAITTWDPARTYRRVDRSLFGASSRSKRIATEILGRL